MAQAAAHDYRLYTKRHYFDTLIARYQECGKGNRILLMTMSFEPSEPEIAAIMTALEGAAQRGADVVLGIDARSFMDGNSKPDPAWFRSSTPGPLWFHTELPERLRPPYSLKAAILQRLGAHPNVQVVITNKPKARFSLTIAGRSHIKLAIIDDEIILGGCNLDSPDNTDVMIAWRDAADSDMLYKTMREALSVGNIRQALGGIDLTIPTGHDQILVDAGVPGQSKILSEALQLIESAQDWLIITCQFFPNSITARQLLAARRRGVDVKIYYSHLSGFDPVQRSIQACSQLIERARVPGDMFSQGLRADQPFLHAKVIASDAGVMIGSHNYVNAGVRLGTAEIALLSHDTELAERAAAMIRQAVTASKALIGAN